MNIVEAFIKKYSQLIILIIGMPCTNKSEIAKELKTDLNIPIININSYLNKSKYDEVIFQNIKFKIYDFSENYDWEKFNFDVNSLKTSGVIIYGNYLDLSKINFKYDFAFFYSMNVLLCKKILNEKKIINFNESEPISQTINSKEKIYFDNIFNPKYQEIKKKIKFNKFFNIKKDTTFDDSYNELFDLLMNLIESKLKNQITN